MHFRLAAALCLACLPLAPSVRAQNVAYWRSLTIPDGRATILPVQVYSGIAPNPMIFTVNGYYRIDQATGTVSQLFNWNNLVRATLASQVSLYPTDSSALGLRIVGQQLRVSDYNLASNIIILPQRVLPQGALKAFFNSTTQTFVVLSEHFYTYNAGTGTLTQVVSEVGNVLRGAVGANDTIWLLMINAEGTREVRSLSGDGSYAPGTSFAVGSDAVSMAVSQWGTIYVSSQTTESGTGNRVTSVTAYSPAGEVLQTFSGASAPVTGAGTSYINVNSRGVIDVVAGETGFQQQWFDPAAFGATRAVPGGTYADSVGGSEGLAAFSYDTATLTGTNTYSGVTALVNGTLVFGNAGALSPNTSLGFYGGTLQISPDYAPGPGALRTSSAAAQDVRVDTNGQSTSLVMNAGAGSTLTKLGAGTLTITNDATYDGVTTLAAGTLRIGDGGPSGSLASPSIVNQGALVFDRSNASGYGGVISGNGSVTKDGLGTLTLSGANTYTGGTTVAEGTLLLGAGHRLAANGALTLSGGTFASGGFSQTFGPLTLEANSTLDFGDGASALVFADSAALAWHGTLRVKNFTNGLDLLRIGTSDTSVTLGQLAAIDFGPGFAAQIDLEGYITPVAAVPVPEPAAWVGIAGVTVLGVAMGRRRFQKSGWMKATANGCESDHDSDGGAFASSAVQNRFGGRGRRRGTEDTAQGREREGGDGL